MKKVAIFIGTAHKKHTHLAVNRFIDKLQVLGAVECENVILNDYQIGLCRGCKICFQKGEEFCPVKDDRDVLIEKMMASDGVVFATPNYSFQVAAILKLFLDRLGFVFHRPRFFGKAYTSIIAQGIYGGQKIERYLNFVGMGLGFNTVKGVHFTAFDPMTKQEEERIEDAMTKLSRRFYDKLIKPAYPTPSMLMLMGFRMGRTSMRLELDSSSRDYTYYQEKGWFESDYFYPARLGLIKRTAGNLFDAWQARITKNRTRLLISPAIQPKC